MPGNLPYMHHLGVAFPVRKVEQMKHIFLKLLAILIDVFPGLE